MPLLPAKVNVNLFLKSEGITPRKENVVNSEIKLRLPFMVSQKLNAGQTY
jgi:hypothetical protein